MATVIRVLARNWYAGASLYATAYDSDGDALVARSAMTESPAGSGCFDLTVAAWDTSWVGRIVYDDGSIFRTEPFAADAGGGALTTEQAEQLDAIETQVYTFGSGVAVHLSPVGTGGKITVYTSYNWTEENGSPVYRDGDSSVLPTAGSTVRLVVGSKASETPVLAVDGTVIDMGGGTLRAQFDVTAADLEAVRPANYTYEIYDADGIALKIVGTFAVIRGHAAAG